MFLPLAINVRCFEGVDRDNKTPNNTSEFGLMSGKETADVTLAVRNIIEKPYERHARYLDFFVDSPRKVLNPSTIRSLEKHSTSSEHRSTA